MSKMIKLKEKKMHKKTSGMSIKKQIVLTIAIMLIGIFAVVGASYAVFTASYTDTQENKVVVGTLTVSFHETEGSVINLNNAYPMTEIQGQKTKPYSFTITNTGTINSNYTVKLVEDTTASNVTLSKGKINFSFKKDTGSYSAPKLLSAISASGLTIDTGSLAPQGTVTYELKLWIDEKAGTEVQGQTYKAKISVDSVQA